MITVLVVDDHLVVRSGLTGLIETTDDIVVIAEAGNGTEALALTQSLAEPPNVALMDLRMPGMDGVEATRRLIALVPELRVLILTTYDTDRDVLHAVEAGACGYLLKDCTREELVSAIRSAAAGETVLAAPIAARLMARMRDPRPALSDREREVLRAVARGQSNPDIAASLHIGEATVKSHLLRIFQKLDVDDRTLAVMVAIERGEL